ncbi:2-oxo-4-hydroxy-4-carboxy-5-ureidoimidazoline decarboxylase [Comamonas odontotermitis]|uniref:2-oxo-4-hydroxy-4-carboxy-5-ureidoimidazoline decarboxylase n=1 Tax=Comamonas odontotermitis TaxID=379895 RepID=A0ABR6RD74_9BURK|nr:2-oxo-4-hydroxy-4-carboxy-5-ureidoimidazoline decarboxylase [Comamonas odontotermitis]MBB6577079.1 2-oxo-4-hydroxy-4-carboxy-5-ureidoimidazoline decarboxylase [Comamonas odontotermitis]
MTTTSTHPTPSLDELNTMAHGDFVAALGEVFEYAPWVAESAARQRPFAGIDALHAAMLAAVHASPREQAVRFLCGHPELSASAVRSGTLTSDSQQEQQSAGLGDLEKEQGERLATLNQTYRTRHGFPFIACVRHYTRMGLFAELASRTERDTEQEFAEALRQIGFISRLRLAQRVRMGSLQAA